MAELHVGRPQHIDETTEEIMRRSTDPDPHASARDRKLARRRAFIEDNRRSVRTLADQLSGRKFNRPQRGGVRDEIVSTSKKEEGRHVDG